MSELQHYYSEYACGHGWVREDAAECGCRGNGWWLSQVDTWHKCSHHYVAGQAHPEDHMSDDECDVGEAAPVVAYIAPASPTVYDENDIPF